MARQTDPVVGGMAKAPSDAPQEVTHNLKPELLAEQQKRARMNEREFPPFNPKPLKAPVPAEAVAPAPTPTASAMLDEVFGADPTPEIPVAPVFERTHPAPEPLYQSPVAEVLEVDNEELAFPELTKDERDRMPAASNSESPARGILPGLSAPQGDKFDGLPRGGFSDMGGVDYFPLDGVEAAELVRSVFAEISEQIRHDSRFQIGLTYPRLRLKVSVEIEGNPEDDRGGFVIQKIRQPKAGEKGGTPKEIALAHADEVVFVVQAVRQEFTKSGEVESPPDALREQMGVSVPRKQIIEDPLGRSHIDVGTDLRALTR